LGSGFSILLLAGLAPLCAFLFNRPDRVAAMWKSLAPAPPEGIPRLKAVMLECVLFIALLVAVHTWAGRVVGSRYVPNVLHVVLVTGIVCDLAREWRAREADPTLVPIWEIHQLYAVAPAVRLLTTEGISSFARGLRLRSLLQFFGPYVPVQILVPAEHAVRAHAILQARWPDGSGRNEVAQATGGSLGAAPVASDP
jgi:preprotein translocase subunit SecY